MFFKKKKKLAKSATLSDKNRKCKLSFCMSHKNRLDFLKQTLSINLAANLSNADQIEFVLVDFDSEEDVNGWVVENFQAELSSGYLKYYTSDALDKWDASKAKNTAHEVANGAIVVNLDCDNFTGPQGGQFVLDAFGEAKNEIVFWQYSGKKLDGTFGRIATTKEAFSAIGGYDESFLPMGFQDGDLRNRLVAHGCQLIQEKNGLYARAIKNEKYVPTNMSWKEMNETNQKTSKENIKAGNIIANEGNYGLTEGMKYFNPECAQFELFNS